eukprot:396505_1
MKQTLVVSAIIGVSISNNNIQNTNEAVNEVSEMQRGGAELRQRTLISSNTNQITNTKRVLLETDVGTETEGNGDVGTKTAGELYQSMKQYIPCLRDQTDPNLSGIYSPCRVM